MRHDVLTGEQIQAARTLVRMNEAELARAAGVSVETIKRLEGMRGMVGTQAATMQAIRKVLESAGAIFINDSGSGPAVRLRKHKG